MSLYCKLRILIFSCRFMARSLHAWAKNQWERTGSATYSVTIQMKATEQYFPIMLFITLQKLVLTFFSVDAILKCDKSNGGY